MPESRRTRAEAMYGREGCERLSRSRVGLFGAGVLGGPTGQQLALVGARLLVVDCDVVEPANLGNQAFRPHDVGRPKAVVRAEQYAGLNPDCDVTPLCARIESCGLGTFAELDLIVTGLDSRRARMYVCGVAEHLGIPWLDAAVDASGRRLGTVTFYDPRDESSACYACRYSPADLAVIAREGRGPGCPSWRSTALPVSPPTLTSPAFAGIVSSCQALHAITFLLGPPGVRSLEPGEHEPLLGKQLVIHADGPLRVRSHELRRSARCPMSHRPLDPLARSASRTVGELLAEARSRLGVAPTELLLHDRLLIPALCCPGCGERHDVWQLVDALSDADVRCASCGEELVPSELMSCVARPRLGELEPRSWRDLGLPPSDVVSVRGGDAVAHFIVGGPAGAGALVAGGGS